MESFGRFTSGLGQCLLQKRSIGLLGHDIRDDCSACDAVVLALIVKVNCIIGVPDALVTFTVALTRDSKDEHRTPTTLGDDASY